MAESIYYKRLNKLWLSLGYKSANSFALSLGYERSEKISKLKRDEKAKPSVDVIEEILKKYSNANPKWLLLGEHPILFDEKLKQYEISESRNASSEPTVKTYSCPDCIDKQKEIDRLKEKLGDVQEKYIATLEELQLKNSNRHCG